MFRKPLVAAGIVLAFTLAGCAPPADEPKTETTAEAPAGESPAVEAATPPASAEPAPAPAPAPPPVAAAPKPKPKPQPKPQPVDEPPPPPPVCEECGVVSSVTPVRKKGDGSGAGAVLGAAIGGVIGHQFGGGRGKDVATAAGAIGGAVAGHQTEKQIRATTHYDVGVKMENGTFRTVSVADASGISAGSRVRVVGNDIQLR